VIVFKQNSYYTADLKNIKSKSNLTIADRISYGGNQGRNVIVNAANDIDYKILVDGINTAVYRNKELNSVVIFYKNRRKTYMRSQIKSNKFPTVFYKDFIKN
jgi:hypothetical protein